MRLILLPVLILISVTFGFLRAANAQTVEQHNDPEYWRALKERTLSRTDPRGMGKTLEERVIYCNALIEDDVGQEHMRAHRFLRKYSAHFSRGGYITRAAYSEDARMIQTFANVAIRDIRYVVHEGAELARCHEVRDIAITSIRNVIRKYPDFDKYNPTEKIVYGH